MVHMHQWCSCSWSTFQKLCLFFLPTGFQLCSEIRRPCASGDQSLSSFRKNLDWSETISAISLPCGWLIWVWGGDAIMVKCNGRENQMGNYFLLFKRDIYVVICVVCLELCQPSSNSERNQHKRRNQVTKDSREEKWDEFSPRQFCWATDLTNPGAGSSQDFSLRG